MLRPSLPRLPPSRGGGRGGRPPASSASIPVAPRPNSPVGPADPHDPGGRFRLGQCRELPSPPALLCRCPPHSCWQGWHRPPGYAEVQTPVLDGLVKAGIELDRAYQYQSCSPTRSSLQSGKRQGSRRRHHSGLRGAFAGRQPIHVNFVNCQGNDYNPKDPVSGFQGIPRNITGVAEHLRRGGYATHQVSRQHQTRAPPCLRSALGKTALPLRLGGQVGRRNGDDGPHPDRPRLRHFIRL